MVTVTYDIWDAPKIGQELKEIIDNLENQDEYVLSFQLDYRDSNSIFNLSELDKISFNENLVEITYRNNTHVFFNYDNILEYCIINKEDVIEMEPI